MAQLSSIGRIWTTRWLIEWLKPWLTCSVVTVVSPASDINHADLLALDVDKDAARKHVNSAASGIPGGDISQGDNGLWTGVTVVTMAAEALVGDTGRLMTGEWGYWQILSVAFFFYFRENLSGVNIFRIYVGVYVPLYSKWFEHCLTNRMRYIASNSIESGSKIMYCGVPQSSILGQLLFLLYTNNMSTMSGSCFSILFADDTNMFITGKDIQDMCHRLNEDLVKIHEWLRCNKLSLSVSKTHYMVFIPRIKIVDEVNIIIHNEKIDSMYHQILKCANWCPIELEKVYWKCW